jgi:hypothetical protein
MKQNEYKQFLNAVDIVCINCLKLSEENCEKCPVRFTCDHLADAQSPNINKYEEEEVEKLKADAESLGYRLVKKQVYAKLLHCNCGCKPVQHMVYNGRQFVGYAYACQKCDVQSMPHKMKYKAKLNWNEMINGGNVNESN